MHIVNCCNKKKRTPVNFFFHSSWGEHYHKIWWQIKLPICFMFFMDKLNRLIKRLLFSHPPLPVIEELSLSLYSSHKTSSLFAAGFADSGIFYNGLGYEVPYIQNKPASNALTVPSLSLRTSYSAPQLTARSIRPFTLIITYYFLCTFSQFPSFFCTPPMSNPTNINIHYHLSIWYCMRGPFSPKQNVFLTTHTWVHTDTIL